MALGLSTWGSDYQTDMIVDFVKCIAQSEALFFIHREGSLYQRWPILMCSSSFYTIKVWHFVFIHREGSLDQRWPICVQVHFMHFDQTLWLKTSSFDTITYVFHRSLNQVHIRWPQSVGGQWYHWWFGENENLQFVFLFKWAESFQNVFDLSWFVAALSRRKSSSKGLQVVGSLSGQAKGFKPERGQWSNLAAELICTIEICSYDLTFYFWKFSECLRFAKHHPGCSRYFALLFRVPLVFGFFVTFQWSIDIWNVAWAQPQGFRIFSMVLRGQKIMLFCFAPCFRINFSLNDDCHVMILL